MGVQVRKPIWIPVSNKNKIRKCQFEVVKVKFLNSPKGMPAKAGCSKTVYLAFLVGERGPVHFVRLGEPDCTAHTLAFPFFVG
jgi:hypothetical protein